MKSKIYEIRVNPGLKNEKSRKIKGKSAKFAPAFIKNKANFVNSEINISSFLTSKYEKVAVDRAKKTNPIKPNTKPIQTQ